MITLKSTKLNQIVNLDKFLTDSINKQEDENTTCLAIWGKEQIDNNKQLSTLRLIDNLYFGFGDETKPYALHFSKDDNIHYDVLTHNNLYSLLLSDWKPSSDEISEATQAIEMINKYCISKYNQYPIYNPSEEIDFANDILLIDQSVNSESIASSNANTYNFSKMIAYAFEAFPHSKIYIKYHPNTINGLSDGYLKSFVEKNRLQDHPSIKIIDEHVNGASLFYYFDKVFTVTSSLGFEAVLRGKKVYTFADSFYSGWGFTNTIIGNNKGVETTPLEMFIALFIKNSIYINPFNEETGSILDILEYISLQQRHKNTKDILFFKNNRIKTQEIPFLLNTEKEKCFNVSQKLDILMNNDKLVIADSQEKFNQIPSQYRKAFVTDGFLFPAKQKNKHMPFSMIFDTQSSYLETNQNNDLNDMIEREDLTSFELNRSKEFINKFKHLFQEEIKSSKHNLTEYLKENKEIILIPSNSEENYYCAHIDISSDIDLIKKIASENKNKAIIYQIKTIKKDYKNFLQNKDLKSILKENNNTLFIDTENHINQLINISKEIHVVNDYIGMFGLMLGKKIVTYSNSFYSNRGLTIDKKQKNSKLVSLEELVGFTMLLYPRYKANSFSKFISATFALDLYLEKRVEELRPENQTFINRLYKLVSNS
jgi:capsular polysaccharide export protein